MDLCGVMSFHGISNAAGHNEFNTGDDLRALAEIYINEIR